MKHTKCYIKEYPRPQFTRPNWLNLNGEWSFIYEPSKISPSLKRGFETEKKICVPFSYETEKSGINVQEQYEEVWYSRKLTLTKSQMTDVILMHFEGSDYVTTLYVNGEKVGENEGAEHRFSFDIRPFVQEGENTLTVKIQDSLYSGQPRGKQRWKEKNFLCFYVQTTGIWKTVWLEFLPKNYIENVKITPDIDRASVVFDIETAMPSAKSICEIEISFAGRIVRTAAISCNERHTQITVFLNNEEFGGGMQYWYPGAPNLYDVTFQLREEGKVVDEAGSYFGLRKMTTEGNRVMINNRPMYYKLVLDQGYWKESGRTPPDEEALVKDIQLAKAMGFNGARKHQKIEDERFFYYADVLGFFVWCEMPSAYSFNDSMCQKMMTEWGKIVRQHYNHPSVSAWVVLNESWGVRDIYENEYMQALANAMYYQTKTMDSMRPVISNDGWEHTVSDILTLHNYEQNPEKLFAVYDSLTKLTEGDNRLEQRQPYAKGYHYQGQPILMSEYGGTAYVKETTGENWGYGVGCKDEEELAARFEGLYQAVKKMPAVSGICYTQLTDVQQEVNGLLDIARNPKINPETIKKILDK